LVRKANAVEEETKWATWLCHQHHQSIHVTDGVTVTSLPASLLQKMSVTTDRLCQITLHRKLSCKFKKWCKFSSCVKAKSRNTRTTCTRICALLLASNIMKSIMLKALIVTVTDMTAVNLHTQAEPCWFFVVYIYIHTYYMCQRVCMQARTHKQTNKETKNPNCNLGYYTRTPYWITSAVLSVYTVDSDVDFCDYHMHDESCRRCRMKAMQTWQHVLCVCGCLLVARSLNNMSRNFHSISLHI
jgi:hypothetical protein